MKIVCLLLTSSVLLVVSPVSGARILAILPNVSKSHQIFFQAVLKTLAQRGHQVVVYSPYTLQTPMPNYTDVNVSAGYTPCLGSEDLELCLNIFTYQSFPFFEVLAGLPSLFLSTFTDSALQDESIQRLMKTKESFDLVLTEPFQGQEAFLAFGHLFSAPVIGLNAVGSSAVISHFLGNALGLSYIPDFRFAFSNHMDLIERMVNSFVKISRIVSYYFYHIPRQQVLVNRHFKFENPPAVSEMIKNIAMVFLNHHPAVSYAQPMTPNMVSVGGIHVAAEEMLLSEGVRKFMDKAEFGVVYFSLGSIIPDQHLSPDFFSHFARAFGKLKEMVLWKTEAKNITDLSENVMPLPWSTHNLQQAILGHPNCKLFITHAGLMSQLEAVHFAVPVVAMPLFGDNRVNAEFYSQAGIGATLDYSTLSEDSVSSAISKVLNNPEYKDNAVRLSALMHDTPMSSAASAVFWVEHVLRHNSTQHLRPASASQPWYQRALLDVLVACLGLWVATGALLVAAWRTCCRRTKSEKELNYLNKSPTRL